MSVPTRAELLDERDVAIEERHAARRTARGADDALVDVLVVLARWGVDIDRGDPAALMETALRTAALNSPWTYSPQWWVRAA